MCPYPNTVELGEHPPLNSTCCTSEVLKPYYTLTTGVGSERTAKEKDKKKQKKQRDVTESAILD